MTLQRWCQRVWVKITEFKEALSLFDKELETSRRISYESRCIKPLPRLFEGKNLVKIVEEKVSKFFFQVRKNLISQKINWQRHKHEVWKIKYTFAKIRKAAHDLLMHSCVFWAELDFLTKTCTVLPSTPQASRIALKRHKINKNKVVLASAVPFSKRYLKYSWRKTTWRIGCALLLPPQSRQTNFPIFLANHHSP